MALVRRLAEPSPVTTSPARAGGAVSELTWLMFDHADRGRVHGIWRELLSAEAFRYRTGLSPAQRTALAYDRLRIVSALAGDPLELAQDARRLASLHEWIGVVDGAVAILAGIHYNLFLGSLTDHDSCEERDLTELLAMRRIGTFLCTELGHGNDAAALRTTAELDRATGEFVLNTPAVGAQKFMPNTSTDGGPKSALVAARLLIDGEDQGVFLFLTPLTDALGPLPRIRIRRLADRAGSPVDHCLTSFDQLRLPRSALLEGPHGRLAPDGFTSALGSRRKRFLRSIARVTTGKLCMSAAALGVTRASLSVAVRHAHHRTISGPRAGERIPLTAHRSHHGRLLAGVADAYAMAFLHRRAVTRWTEHGDTDRVFAERFAAITKAWVTWRARAITIECRERSGALGLFPVNGIADHPLNLEGAITAEGDNLVICLKAASEMLFEPGTERRSRREVALAEQSLTDPAFLRDLLADVEGLWRQRARTALRQGPPRNQLDRWNAASSAAFQMVVAYALLQAADSLQLAIGRAVDATARRLLEQLHRLFLLQHLDRHTGILLAQGLMTSDHVCTLPAAIDTVVADLAPHLMTLVEAFDLPADFLDSIPLANEDLDLRFDRVVEDATARRPVDVSVRAPR